MGRKRTPLPFKQTDVERAYKAARVVGMRNPRIEIDMARRTITLIPGAGDDRPENPWDTVLTDAADEKRAS